MAFGILDDMKKKIVFIGNSIVNGFPFRRSECFASLVRQDSDMEVINKGNNGETTADILRRFDKDVLAHSPDIVFILTGTNDSIYKDATPGEAFENLMIMAQKSKEAGISPVFFTPVPVDAKMASRMWMADADIDYNAVNRDLEKLADFIRASKLNFIDLTAQYKSCGKYHDGIHPLPEGHRFIANLVLEYLNIKNQ